MTFKALQNLITNTTAYTAVGASQIALPASVIAMLSTQLAGGYYTAVSVTDGVGYEVMNIVSVTAGAADVVRGQDGTVAVPLAAGSQVRFVWTTAGIGDVAPGGAITLTGSGGTTVTGGPNYNVNSPAWTFTAGAGMDVSFGPGPFDVLISQTSIGTPFTFTGTGIAEVTGGPYNFNINVDGVILTAGTGISISGTYPAFTINSTIVPGAPGTVLNLVAGPGITISGSTPTINPTVGLTPTGPGAGTYGGISLNAYGQVTGFTGSLISSVTTTTSGLTLGGPTNGLLTIDIRSADSTHQGLVQLAPNTTAGSRDSANNTQAVTPAGLDTVLDALELGLTVDTLSVVGNQNALSPTAYTNPISGFVIPVIVVSGRFAVIDLYVEMYDPLSLSTIQTFGVGLFDATGVTLLAGVSNTIASNIRHLKYRVTGPLSGNLVVKTTPLAGTQVIGSYYAHVIGN
jgi:hypothetical protein